MPDETLAPSRAANDAEPARTRASRADGGGAGRTDDASLETLRARIRARYGLPERELVAELLAAEPLDGAARERVRREATALVETLRAERSPTMMESFLGEYGLSTREGVGLMCLAEALLRVPDATTIDELIADKLEHSDWSAHLGRSSSPLVNASTWALLITGRVLDDGEEDGGGGPVAALRPLVRRLGEPVVRRAVAQAMRLLGKQFVLGRDIDEAMDEARAAERRGYTHSYDMLGEAARTDADARRYHAAYAHAIERLAKVGGDSVAERPGISVKLSALHPRYEWTHRERVTAELLPRARELARAAARAGIGFNIDAEEADRLDLSLDLIEALVTDPELAGWDGFGVVVQAYGRRALPVIAWLAALARRERRRLMVRLVKGAYWDTEIKEAQVLGLASFPVYTRKANTDLSYLVCARALLAEREVIYPQFATHNAHTVAAIGDMAGEDPSAYEFQRLHGMGESLHETVRERHGTRCRIYAPVGAHVDLLAYLVRRLLENGANSSFVNRIVDESVPAEEVAACPIAAVEAEPEAVHPAVAHPLDLYAPRRVNSKGFRLNDPASVRPLLDARDRFAETRWDAAPMLAGSSDDEGVADGGETTPEAGRGRSNDPPSRDRGPTATGGTTDEAREAASGTAGDDRATPRHSPTEPDRVVGRCRDADDGDVDAALDAARAFAADWAARDAAARVAPLVAAADAYEDRVAELSALLCREAGKTLLDAIAEVREAVDFLRYYAIEAERRERERASGVPHGTIACISPWNFPLAIFTGQIAGALASGNVVVAKPAEQTPIVAARAVSLLHAAGVPRAALQLLPGDGRVGARLTGDARVDGVCFTGSTEVARLIERALASRDADDVSAGATADPMLIAETGGLNAMIVDSTALTEQVVRDVIVSAFQSAGQRCSALRVLYVQKEAESRVLEMLTGALDALSIEDPWRLSCDVGPVIDTEAKEAIESWVETQRAAGRLLHRGAVPAGGHFVAPAIVRIDGIASLEREVFGPVLHVATFDAESLERVVDEINARGYGLTFGLHTRIDDRVQRVVDRVRVGNVYVNRNQIGAVVGSQPFGGEGLSGTGPKAGGPLYLGRFVRPAAADGARAGARGADAHTPGAEGEGRGASDGGTRHDDAGETARRDTRAKDGERNGAAAGSSAAAAPEIDRDTLAEAFAALPAPGRVARGHGLAAGGRVLPGPTGESNRLSVHPRGRVLLVGDDTARALRLVADARAAGCPVLAVSASEAPLEALALEWEEDGVATLHGTLPDAHVTALAGLDALAVASDSPAEILRLRRALAEREGPIVPLVAAPGDVARFVVERHVCIDTTAAGGNASLLAASG